MENFLNYLKELEQRQKEDNAGVDCFGHKFPRNDGRQEQER